MGFLGVFWSFASSKLGQAFSLAAGVGMVAWFLVRQGKKLERQKVQIEGLEGYVEVRQGTDKAGKFDDRTRSAVIERLRKSGKIR